MWKNKKILIFGVFLAAFLMLMMPTINVVNAEVVKNEKKDVLTTTETNDLQNIEKKELKEIKNQLFSFIEKNKENLIKDINSLKDLLEQFINAIIYGIPCGIGLTLITLPWAIILGIFIALIPDDYPIPPDPEWEPFILQLWGAYIEEFPILGAIFGIINIIATFGLFLLLAKYIPA